MKFTPRTEAELIQERLLKIGEGNFEVTKCEEKTFNGKQVLSLTLKAWDCEGRQGNVFDNIYEDSLLKLRSLCYSAKRGELYERGDVKDYELVGLSGKFKIGIRKNKKDETLNCVLSYIIPKNDAQPVSTTAEADDDLNDDIPF